MAIATAKIVVIFMKLNGSVLPILVTIAALSSNLSFGQVDAPRVTIHVTDGYGNPTPGRSITMTGNGETVSVP